MIEANFEIIRKNRKIQRVSVSMPIWTKTSDTDSHLSIQMPLLGIESIAKDELDAEQAIEEAVRLFCIASEKYGNGLETELEATGWKLLSSKQGKSLGIELSDDLQYLDRIFQTGENYVGQDLDLIPEGDYA
jgi:hypothetical protein